MARQRIRSSPFRNLPNREKRARFAPRSLTAQEKPDPPGLTQRGLQDRIFNQSKFDAFGLQLKKENGAITSEEQERLSVLQANMDHFWTKRMERAKAQPNLLRFLARNPRTEQAAESRASLHPPKIQAKGSTVGDRSESSESAAKPQSDKPRRPGPLEAGAKDLSRGGSLDGVGIHFTPGHRVVQRREIGLFGLEAEVLDRFTFTAFDDKTSKELDIDSDPAYDILSDPGVVLEEYALGELDDIIKITLDNEVKIPNTAGFVERSYTLEFIQKPVDVLERFGQVKETSAAWSKTTELWQLVHQKAGTELKEIMSEMKDVRINDKLTGEQFSTHESSDLVTKETTSNGDVFHLDWTKISGSVAEPSEDPKVGPQLTAGASLIALDKAFLATHQPLYQGKKLSSETADRLKIKAPKDEGELAKSEVMGMVNVIKRYLAATRPQPPKTKRYMKEYVPLMTRNSLDSVYAGMSPRGQLLFSKISQIYLANKSSNFLQKRLKASPDEKIFNYTSTKEGGATSITVEQLILSILKMKKSEAKKDQLEIDSDAGPGDAFAQSGLEGISEIRENNPEILKKYGIQSADEMMKGVKGIIFENRLARPIPLSEMPKLFMDSVHALRTVQELFDEQRRMQREEAFQRRLEEDSRKARGNKFAYQY